MIASNIPHLRFTADGEYDLSTAERRAAAAEAALRVIATITLAYHDKGPEYCRDEMARTARELASKLARARGDR